MIFNSVSNLLCSFLFLSSFSFSPLLSLHPSLSPFFSISSLPHTIFVVTFVWRADRETEFLIQGFLPAQPEVNLVDVEINPLQQEMGVPLWGRQKTASTRLQKNEWRRVCACENKGERERVSERYSEWERTDTWGKKRYKVDKQFGKRSKVPCSYLCFITQEQLSHVIFLFSLAERGTNNARWENAWELNWL